MAANVFTVDAAAAQSDNIAMSDVAAGPAEAASTAPRKSGDEISLVTALNSPSIAGYTVVGSGESLWQIAAARTRAGGDVRDQVAAIKTANGLGDDYVFAGQVLRLPASN